MTRPTRGLASAIAVVLVAGLFAAGTHDDQDDSRPATTERPGTTTTQPAATVPSPTSSIVAEPTRPSTRPAAGGSSGSGSSPDRPSAVDDPSDPTSSTTSPLTSSAPTLGDAGAPGPCLGSRRSIPNPRNSALAVWIFEPSGDAAASIAGGRCNDPIRPVVFIAHGYGSTDPGAYSGLIEHLVSVGNVVVYPSYAVTTGDRPDLEESYRVADAGIVAAVDDTDRIDTGRTGWWGHSHGGGMIPYLVQQGAARGWGSDANWMTNVAQAYSQLVGTDDIQVPPSTEAMTVSFDNDAFADARLGIDVYRSLTLPVTQRRYVTLRSDFANGFSADHSSPQTINGVDDAVDRALWRYADLLQLCAVHRASCDADLEHLPDPDGTLVRRATVTSDPSDFGPFPAILAECDAIYGPTLNPRIGRCGPTRL